MIKIQPVLIFRKGIATNLHWDINYYPGANQVNLNWVVSNDSGNTLDRDTLPVPKEILDQWTSDDSVITNYVLQQLELTALPIL